MPCASAAVKAAAPVPPWSLWLLSLAAILLPVSLLGDFSWESTVGVDLFWAPPHTLTYAAMILAAAGAMALMRTVKDEPVSQRGASRLGPVALPLGGWLVLWGALAFATALLFDLWWQSAYGLQAGIWHPPQLLKAGAFFAMLGGVWLVFATAEKEPGRNSVLLAALFCCAGGGPLVLITLVRLTASYPNLQHSASFYNTACATYPLALAALAVAGRLRWSATLAALVYTMVVAGMLWLLPLIPARPLAGPIYNPLEQLMPPPFPLLLFVPAVAMDWLMKRVSWPAGRTAGWLQAAALGLVFFALFLGAQWFFAQFLLTEHSDNWFFGGGGQHWPFFLKISAPARVMFWTSPDDMMNWNNALWAAVFSMASARLGLWLGAWLLRLRR